MTLHKAASDGNLRAMRRLIAGGADVNARDTGPKTVYSPSWTPLHYAAAAGYVDAVRLLLEAGGAVDAQSTNGQTPLQYAAKEGHREVVRVLLEAGADGDMSMCPLLERGMTLHEAARRGDVAAIRALIAEGADVNGRLGPKRCYTTPGLAPLHFAAAAGKVAAVCILVEAGADVDALGEQDPLRRSVGGAPRGQVTPLHCAIHAQHIEVMRALLDAGADVNMKWYSRASGGWLTPIEHAVKIGRFDMAQALVDSGADVVPTMADRARGWGSTEAVTFLQRAWREGVDARIRQFMEDVKGTHVGNRHDVFEQISPILFWFADHGVEALVALLLRKNNTVAAAAVKVGESTRVDYDPRPVFDAAEKCGAAKMIFAHNHPNASSPRPSDEDVLSCVDLSRECEDRGLELADDLVVCRTSEGRTLKSVTQTTRFRDMTRGY